VPAPHAWLMVVTALACATPSAWGFRAGAWLFCAKTTCLDAILPSGCLSYGGNPSSHMRTRLEQSPSFESYELKRIMRTGTPVRHHRHRNWNCATNPVVAAA